MNITKQIKSESKNLMTNNWVVAIFSVLILFAVAYIILSIIIITSSLTEVFSANDVIAGNLISNLSFIAFTLLSPLKNGFLKLFYNISTTGTSNLKDVFYFFNGTKKYTHTLLVNLYILGRAAINFLICMIPAFVSTIFFENAVVFSILCILGVVISLFLSSKLYIIDFVYIDEENY